MATADGADFTDNLMWSTEKNASALSGYSVIIQFRLRSANKAAIQDEPVGWRIQFIPSICVLTPKFWVERATCPLRRAASPASPIVAVVVGRQVADRNRLVACSTHAVARTRS